MASKSYVRETFAFHEEQLNTLDTLRDVAGYSKVGLVRRAVNLLFTQADIIEALKLPRR